MESKPPAATEVADRPTRVAIALVGRDGSYLVRRRPEGTVLGGYWEFPGGKCEAGECPSAAAARECREELGMDVVVGRLRRRIEHHYAHGPVELSFFDCVTASPDAEPAAGTGFRWVAAGSLLGLAFPPANAPILDELALDWAGTKPLD
jgi:mutator protein MutT